MTSGLSEPILVFFSYAREDEEFRDELEKHLSVLKRQGIIQGWHDRRITPGKKWQDEIDTRLDLARIILLLISVDFLNSDYCYGIEMKRALERHKLGKARVIPIILRTCDWENVKELSQLQALPKDAKAVSRWPDRDEAFTDIAKGIRKAIEELLADLSKQGNGKPITVPGVESSISPQVTYSEDAVILSIGSTICEFTRQITMNVAPYLKNNRAYVPIEVILRAFGVLHSTAILDGGNTKEFNTVRGTIRITDGSNIVTINGAPLTMDVPSEFVYGEVMLPAGWVAWLLGIAAMWDEATQMIVFETSSG